MDAKSKAEFINSVVGGQIPCPSCNTLNVPDSLFCVNCGCKLDNVVNNIGQDSYNTNAPVGEPAKAAPAFAPASESTKATPAFAPASEPVKAVPAFAQAQMAATTEIEEISVFAQGLPSWDMVPPEIMVRRKKKK